MIFIFEAGSWKHGRTSYANDT